MPDTKLSLGIVGSAISAVGASISVTELQAIISIIVTVAGFIISVLVPLGIKLYKKIKKAAEDGVITEEEMKDIHSSVKEIINESSKVIDEVSDKKNQKEKK